MVASWDGHCKAFDKDVSVTLLWGDELSYKKTDRGHKKRIIFIQSSKEVRTIMMDGKVRYTAPSVKGQSECIRMAQRFAKVDPETISYIKTQGIGTRLGGPIEIEALKSHLFITNACALADK